MSEQMWPLQSECDTFYGNPRGRPVDVENQAWKKANLVTVTVPWMMAYAGQSTRRITIHKKCAESLARVIQGIWTASGHNQAVIEQWGMDKYGGSYAYRLMRGLNTLSMHAYGCAVDFDVERNGLGDQTPHFANCPLVLDAFAGEGWVWGGRWKRPDGMHFQAARVG